jgi:uncharacterized protein (DUF58 family)
MSPTPRAALIVLALVPLAFFAPAVLVLGLAVTVAALVVIDALAVRKTPELTREAPEILARGVASKLELRSEDQLVGRLHIRQPRIPDIDIEPSEADAPLEARLTARRRGRHVLPRAATRRYGPLGLGTWTRHVGEEHELRVYPDIVEGSRLALAVRQGKFRELGQRSRGPLGLGTEFESVREYLPDDDFRQLNWRATARLGRPMSNQYRIEQDRDVICVVDLGRLMAAPAGDRTRLDAALDAAVAVCAVADEVGDRSGAIAFDSEIRRRVSPRRRGARTVTQAFFDLEPTSLDSDYGLAFHAIGSAKRAFVLVLTDLLEEVAARSLLAAMPLLSRRHAVVVASASDPDLTEILTREPETRSDVMAASVANEMLTTRARVASRLRRTGAEVIEARPDRLAAACTRAYLTAKSRARL